jgi:hypothetical protein
MLSEFIESIGPEKEPVAGRGDGSDLSRESRWEQAPMKTPSCASPAQAHQQKPRE